MTRTVTRVGRSQGHATGVRTLECCQVMAVTLLQPSVANISRAGRDEPMPSADWLLPVRASTSSMTPSVVGAVKTVPVDTLHPNPLNPRGNLDAAGLQDLADSIRAQGVLQPLLVTPGGVVVAGHRRLAAARLAGLDDVPVIVRDLDEIQQQEIILVENLQRQDLSALEEARAYRQLLDGGHTAAQLARRVGVPAARINARLVLLKLDQDVQWMFHRGDLPLTLAPVLVKVADPLRQRQVATMAVRRQLTVSEIERIVDRGIGALQAPPPRQGPPPGATDKQGLSPSRVVAIEHLAQRATSQVSLAELSDLFQATCCACGAEDLPTYCTACPMLDLVNRVLARADQGQRAA